jgi:hypothetical protein
MRINHTRGVSIGHIADASLISSHDVFWNHYGRRRVKVTRRDTAALRRPQRGIKTRSGASSQGAAHRLAAARRPPAGLDLEPARLETAGGVPRYSASNQQLPDQTMNPGTSTETSETSARRRTHRSPMLAHETSPVSGASVMGMTNGACHGPSYMPASVPGVSTALR